MSADTLILASISDHLPRVGLRPMVSDDACLYGAWFNDPIVRKMLHPRTPSTQTEINGWLNRMLNDSTKDYQLIEFDDQPAGHLGLKNLDDPARSIEIGCVIGRRDLLGSFAGVAAGYLGVKRAFEVHGADAVWLSRTVLDRPSKNERENKLWSELGFSLLGISDNNFNYQITRSRFEALALSLV